VNESLIYFVDTIDSNKKLHQWHSESNIYQETTDREADSKIAQWPSRTNVFLNSRDQIDLSSRANL